MLWWILQKSFSDETIFWKTFFSSFWFSIKQLEDSEGKLLGFHRLLVHLFFPFITLLFTWLSGYDNSRFYLLKMVNANVLKSHPRKTYLVKFGFPGLNSIKHYFRKYKMVAFSFYLSYFCDLNKIGRNSLNFFFCDLINYSICKKFAREKNLISYKLESVCIFANKTHFEKFIWLKFVEVGGWKCFNSRSCLQ